MTDLRMSHSDREAFLADVRIGVLSVERSDGPPLTTPVWYLYEPGAEVRILTESGALKNRLLRRAGRASLCAQREEYPYAYVTIDGPVEFDEASPADRLAVAIRYLGPEAGRSYVEHAPAADDVLVRITPERWFSTDYAALGFG